MTGGLFGIIIPSSFLHFWGYHWVWLCWSMVLGHQCFATSSEWSRHELANLGLLCRWFTKRVIIVYYNTLIPAQLNSLEKTAERIVENPTAARARAYRVSSLWLGSRWIGMNFLAENGTNGTRCKFLAHVSPMPMIRPLHHCSRQNHKLLSKWSNWN